MLHASANRQDKGQTVPKAWGTQQLVPAQRSIHPFLRLQNTVGNRAVQRLVQAQLTVGAADDEYEREADRVARQVMSMSDATVARALRRAALPEEDRKLLTKPRAETLTRRAQGPVGEDEEELIQTRRAEPDVGSFEAGDEIETQLSLSKGRGSSLPEPVRAFMEPRFGVDFDQVRVHSDNEAVQMNEAVGARAFTHGQDIYFGVGQSPTDLALTAHELTHVVQQTGGMPLQAKRREELSPMAAGPSVQRACVACASGAAPCPRCAEEGSALRRKHVMVQRMRSGVGTPSIHDISVLQHTFGNQAVGRLLHEGGWGQSAVGKGNNVQ